MKAYPTSKEETFIEYTMLAAMIAVVLAVGVITLSTNLHKEKALSSEITSSPQPTP